MILIAVELEAQADAAVGQRQPLVFGLDAGEALDQVIAVAQRANGECVGTDGAGELAGSRESESGVVAEVGNRGIERSAGPVHLDQHSHGFRLRAARQLERDIVRPQFAANAQRQPIQRFGADLGAHQMADFLQRRGAELVFALVDEIDAFDGVAGIDVQVGQFRLPGRDSDPWIAGRRKGLTEKRDTLPDTGIRATVSAGNFMGVQIGNPSANSSY